MTVQTLSDARPGVMLRDVEHRNGVDPSHDANGFVVKIREATDQTHSLPLKASVMEPASPDDICTTEDAREASAEGGPSDLSKDTRTKFKSVTLKVKGVGDEMHRSNLVVHEAICCLAKLLQRWPALQLRVADCDMEMNEALKLYRDMNHLSLAGGITCEQVLHHVQSHTILLYYRASDSEPQLAVTAATFSMRDKTMMLRLLATHPRMTRKGFARITVHFLKELCRALRKTEILVYTYPSSAPFYKAMNFRHTRSDLQKPVVAAPAAAIDASAEEVAAAQQQARSDAREARRVFSAQENEMIYHVQSALEHVIDVGFKKEAIVHPYACTRRRASQPAAPAAREAQSKALVAEASANAARRADSRASRSATEFPPPESLASRCGASSLAGCSASSLDSTAWCAAVSPLYTSPQVMRSADSAAASGLPTIGDVVESTPACRTSSDKRSAGALDEDGSTSNGTAGAHADEAGPSAEDAEGEGVSENGAVPQRKRKLAKGEYHVETIVGVRSVGGEIQYLIKWAGWGSNANTWESESNLRNLSVEIDAFESALKSARTCPQPV
uniref:Chromo domain-containing protein n=1 Tax=Coccolithus braarudii TaxID=221442 RepID=A0A7S0Q3R0_9EUKA|mmetsp:Transcript_34086/g.72763  ORF Transcript_34086/g.72763 Transcript_34086/m.72763 type:complete len:560 (+) Transcript_34086:277-1956(+)